MSNRRFMKLDKKEKTGVAIWCVWLAVCIPLFIWAKDWTSIIWQGTFTVCLCIYMKLRRIIDSQSKMIDSLIDLCSNDNMARLERENNFLVENLTYYLERIKILKENLNYYMTLNKNLLDNNSNKGVKNYARTTKQRNH
ncbi:MAG: hypothetical protein IJD91_09890 [Clostridia bacterium]|nr:hypothetical protein [Clostridia bacterium]